MAAPQSWVRGRLYLAISNTTEAQPLTKVVDYSHDRGLNNEDIKYAGAGVTQALSLLASPSIACNFYRDKDQNVVLAAARYWRDSGLGVKFYLYLDITGEATVYAYGYAALEGVSEGGGADAGVKGQFTLRPGPEAVWDDAKIVG
jgi:hypothetical protein